MKPKSSLAECDIGSGVEKHEDRDTSKVGIPEKIDDPSSEEESHAQSHALSTTILERAGRLYLLPQETQNMR